jgi:putative spermidine/putrescine transport system permease protein
MPSEPRRAALLLSPSAIVYLALLAAPMAFLFRTSLLPPGPGAPLEGPVGLASYAQLADAYHLVLFARTLRIALATTALTLALGYPVALAIARSRGARRNLQMLLVVSPLFVSVVVRAYGWVLLFGRRGVVNELLLATGFFDAPVAILHTEGAVVVALTEALLPFMALSILAVLEQLPRELEWAARGLGATPWQSFRHVVLPLTLPGALVGAVFVFLVSMGSYATPALVGGSRVRVVVTEIYTQATAVFDWPEAAALSMALLVLSLAAVFAADRFASRTSS